MTLPNDEGNFGTTHVHRHRTGIDGLTASRGKYPAHLFPTIIEPGPAGTAGRAAWTGALGWPAVRALEGSKSASPRTQQGLRIPIRCPLPVEEGKHKGRRIALSSAKGPALAGVFILAAGWR